jgi:hypothetical protein
VHAEADTGGRELLRPAVESDLAPAQHDDPVEVVGHRRELMGDEQDGRPPLPDQRHQRVAEPALGFDVDAGHGFVEDEELGLGGQGLGDEGPLLLPARQLGQETAAERQQVDGPERGLYRLPVGGPEAAAPPPPGQTAGGHHLLHRGRQDVEQHRALGDVAHPPPFGQLVRRQAEEPDVAALGAEEAEGDAQQRRLPRAVGSDQGHELAGGHGEAGAVEHHLPGVGEGDGVDLQGGGHRGQVRGRQGLRPGSPGCPA